MRRCRNYIRILHAMLPLLVSHCHLCHLSNIIKPTDARWQRRLEHSSTLAYYRWSRFKWMLVSRFPVTSDHFASFDSLTRFNYWRWSGRQNDRKSNADLAYWGVCFSAFSGAFAWDLKGLRGLINIQPPTLVRKHPIQDSSLKTWVVLSWQNHIRMD